MSPRQWGTQGAYSILDQGLLSGANFTLSLLYARWLPPSQYGLFAILLAVFLFFSGFHNAIVLEPMAVLGPSRRRAAESGYIGAVVLLHGAVTLVLGLLVAVVGAIVRVRSVDLGNGFEAVGLALPTILFFWLLRRVCYLRGDPRRAAQSSLLYAGALGATLLLPRSLRSPAFGLLSMVFASLAASVAALEPKDLVWCPDRLPETIREHWRYGRWIVGVALLYWLTGPFFAPLVGYFAGLSSAATFRAGENLLLPLTQVMTALSLLTLPWLSGQVARSGIRRLRTLTVRTSLAGLCISALYVICILATSRILIERVYAGHGYDRSAALLPPLCLASILRSVTDMGAALSLKAALRPDVTFWSVVAGAALNVTIGVALIRGYGLVGAAWAVLLATGVQSAIVVWRFAALAARDQVRGQAVDLEPIHSGGAS